MGKINISQLVQLGYKPGRLIDIWVMKFGRQVNGNCDCCGVLIHPMRVMRKCGGIAGCYPAEKECFVIVNAGLYPGYPNICMLTHRQRAGIAGLVCQSCWTMVAGGNTLLMPGCVSNV